ncbi:MAG: hypothetical protein EXX96DRAFT_26267 [Benjaminiella poitrasii]|nr:MAG: hypothetical protein EXX96DRAFT_26267 [Benjaminiella poitrasii]
MDLDDLAIQYGEISILANFDSVPEPKVYPGEIEGVIDDLVEDFKEVVISTPKKYKKYGEDQIAHFISSRQEEGLGVKEAAEQCGLPRSSAYKL